jgi:uncharacterized protein (TIGR03067 family)
VTTSLLLGLALSISAPATKEAPKEAPKLEGTWLVEKMGDEINVKGGMTFAFKAGVLTVIEPGQPPEIGSYTVDLTKKPMTVDLKPGNEKDLNLPGIIEIKDDTLRMCLSVMGKRPTEFKNELANGTLLFVLKRVVPEK